MLHKTNGLDLQALRNRCLSSVSWVAPSSEDAPVLTAFAWARSARGFAGRGPSRTDPLDEQAGRTHVLKRHRSARDLRTHNRYLFQEVYPNIDLLWEQENGQLKYTFIAAEKADISDIRMHWTGQDGLELTEGGELSVATSVGSLHEKRPYAYQLVEGKEVPCTSRCAREIRSDWNPNDSIQTDRSIWIRM